MLTSLHNFNNPYLCLNWFLMIFEQSCTSYNFEKTRVLGSMDLPLVFQRKRKVFKNPVDYVLSFKYSSGFCLFFVYFFFFNFIPFFKLFYIFNAETHTSQIYWVSHWKIFGLAGWIEIFEEETYTILKHKHHFLKYKKYRNSPQCRVLSRVFK